MIQMTRHECLHLVPICLGAEGEGNDGSRLILPDNYLRVGKQVF